MNSKQILILAIVAGLVLIQFSEISATKKPKKQKKQKMNVMRALSGVFNKVEEEEGNENTGTGTKTGTKTGTETGDGNDGGGDDGGLTEQAIVEILNILLIIIRQFLTDILNTFLDCVATEDCDFFSGNVTFEQVLACIDCVNSNLPPLPDLAIEA